jgi:uncharacterized damage-inducible protein DinB
MVAQRATYLDAHGRYIGGNPEPRDLGAEVTTLLGFLERQRATFAWKSGGLDADQLRSTLGSSSMTLGGMLKHLARFEDDMSTEWLNGQPQLAPWNAVDWDAEHDWDWRTAAEDRPEQLYSRWQDAVGRSRDQFSEAVANGDDERPAEAPSLAYILMNMIEEYARHNGHADLIRESVDGLVGEDAPR